MQRDGELTTAGNVEREPLVGNPSRDLGAQEGFGGVMNVGTAAERRSHLPTAAPEVILIDDEQRCPELLGEIGHGNAGDVDHTVGTTGKIARPDVRRQRKHVCGSLRPRRQPAVLDLPRMPRSCRMDVHIRSGAETPRIASPLAITWRVAAHSARRARCRSLGGSSPCGSTRQES